MRTRGYRTVPSKSSEQKRTSREDDSHAQMVKATQNSAAVSDAEGSLDAAPASEQKRQRKRKKRQLLPPHQRRMVQALGRIEGRILPVGSGIEIVTENGSAFRVSSIGKSGLALRLLGLPDSQRCGKFAFWPAFHKEGITLVSFNSADDWEPQENSPPVDQMFVCGTLQEIESERFCVLVGYGYKKKGEWAARLLPVESVPLPEWTVGQWVDLILHRQGEDWRWQGESHPRGPQVGGGFNSWLPYKETAEVSEPQAQDELRT